MANQEQLEILKQGVEVWNKWRYENGNIWPDLSGANLSEMHLEKVNFAYANLEKTNLSMAHLNEAILYSANLRGADLFSAHCWRVDLSGADLSGTELAETGFSEANLTYVNFLGADLFETIFEKANLHGAKLHGVTLQGVILNDANLDGADLGNVKLISCWLERASLRDTNLKEADLKGTNLMYCSFIGTNLEKADLTNCSVYGVSTWGVKLEGADQLNLSINAPGEDEITVDNLEVAQFIYLILNNKKIRDVINILTSKSVLILGRFADDKRKAILDALRNKLREYNLLPIVFDFVRPIDRNITETVKTLAGISYFVIADITSPKSSPLELQAIVPDYQIPVVPIIQDVEFPFSMINDLRTQHSGLLDPLTYDSEETLIKALKSAIIDPAIEKHNELRLLKAQKPKIRSAKDFLDREME